MVQAAPAGGAGVAILELELDSPAATLALGEALGRTAGPGDVILLSGELGAGKTVLAKGLGRGLGVAEDYAIVSPTFTLLNIYPGRLNFYHADLYRLSASEAAELELLEEASSGVLAVEWAEKAGGFWPDHCLRVEIFVHGPEQRRARLSGPADKLAGLKQIR